MSTDVDVVPSVEPAKAEAGDFPGRFREIIADPVNLLIERHPLAGTVADGLVTLHHGLAVPVAGPGAYYADFSQILVVNRGVHEPLEEYVFQEFLPHLPAAPVMVELGAYWAHYSMWLRLRRPAARLHLVEPDPANLQVGVANLERYGYSASAINQPVSAAGFQVDAFRESRGGGRIDVLHSDIQGAEGEMLDGARRALAERAIDYVFISTHGEALHHEVLERLAGHGYRVEVDSSFDETSSYDGLVFATSPTVPAVVAGFRPLSRTEITRRSPAELIAWAQAMHQRTRR